MSRQIPEETLTKVRSLEIDLRKSASLGDTEGALEIAKEIQALFHPDRTHWRLLRAKLWAFESALDSNRLVFAESGIGGVRKLANKNTRVYLESTSLLAICYLRMKKLNEAKTLICEVILKINNISSEDKRRQFQKRLIERLEEESIFVGLIGVNVAPMNPEQIHGDAVMLIQQRSDLEIFEMVGKSVPPSSIAILQDIRRYSVNQLPPSDQKFLPPANYSEKSLEIGKKTFEILQRISWKTLCHPDSELYKLWYNRIPKVFNEGYFAIALTTTFSAWNIGVPMLASGIAALAMKYSAEEFCEMTQPRGIMIQPSDKS